MAIPTRYIHWTVTTLQRKLCVDFTNTTTKCVKDERHSPSSGQNKIRQSWNTVKGEGEQPDVNGLSGKV